MINDELKFLTLDKFMIYVEYQWDKDSYNLHIRTFLRIEQVKINFSVDLKEESNFHK